jgi:cell division protease FtsH
MSDKVGPIAHQQENESYLGSSLESRYYSESTAQAIDAEVKQIIDTQYQRAKSLLQEHEQDLSNVVKYLIERETLTGEDFQTILEGQELQLEEAASSSEDASRPAERGSGPAPQIAVQPRPT